MDVDNRKYFGTVDYIMFAITLLISSTIGIFFAYKQRNQVSSAEYLVASKSVSWFPIFVSMVASFVSAVGVLGVPSQIYTTGVTFALHTFSFIIPIVLCAEVFTPLFRRLDLVSANEYLEKRFSVGVRILGCVLFHIQYLVYMSVALYAPSLALESVAGVPKYITIISTGVVCTFYTALGGMKAVVWTDVFQSAVMIIGLITTAVAGAIDFGSMNRVFEIASERKRLSIDFSFDPREIHTFWGMFIALPFSIMVTWTVSQPTVQRAVAAKSLGEAKKALYFSYLGIIVIFTLLTLDALIIFAVYADCDLLQSNHITQNDQILPYFVMNKLGHLRGMPGLFTACLFSFALSTLSSGLNGISALFLEDIVFKVFPGISDKKGTNIAKISAIGGGIFITGFSFVVPFMGKFVVKLAIQIFGIMGGPYFAMFALGAFSKRANKYGAYCGALTGFVVGMFLSIGQILYPSDRQLPPISIKDCSFYNSTLNSNQPPVFYPKPVVHSDPIAHVFSISYVWFGMISIVMAYVVGYLVSICTQKYVDQNFLNEDLLYDFESNWLFRYCCGSRKPINYQVHYESSDVIIKKKLDD